ncbi:MAG TPA: hypothetical protein VE172_10890, partial [Stackebrandtia sp.]|uniref:hypothetical protein n=1 Tax=Stackebrandtia sp. TaxID=2023065 RepID=UPI002D2C9629
MSDGTYLTLLHELERLRSTDADASARSRRELERDTARVAAARDRAETERSALTELAGRLSAAV